MYKIVSIADFSYMPFSKGPSCPQNGDDPEVLQSQKVKVISERSFNIIP